MVHRTIIITIKEYTYEKNNTYTIDEGQTMKDCIFRQYDIRGKVGSELPLDEVYALTQAIAYYFLQKNPSVKTVAVGADGRTHSPHIKESVCKALQDSGLQVVFIGICPTPVLYFSLFTLPYIDAGLMITASHNGKEYNGIKICFNKESVWGSQIQEIKRLWQQGAALTPIDTGSYTEVAVIDTYVEWLATHFKSLIGMNLSAVIDCGNGAGGTVMPHVLRRMQWNAVQLLYPEVDGTYPHHEADPIVEKNMQDVRAMLSNSSIEVGLGLDGDCDRMTPMTKEGELVQGDKVLALFAQPILQSHPGAAIVFDVKCSAGLPELIQQWGGNPCISPSGHSIIKDQMKKKKGLLAGELSCHFFFHDRYFGYDDGIYAALRLFELLINSGKSLHELLQVFPKKYSTPEIRIECADEVKEGIVEQVKQEFLKNTQAAVLAIDGIRVSLDYGWGILRASNTQPVLCLRFESDTQEGLQHIQNDFVEQMGLYFDKTILQNALL